MTTPLQKAAQAVIDKWEQSHPLKELAILELRKALDAEMAQSVEPVLYQRRMQANWHRGGNWTAWDDCLEATFKEVLTVPNLHDWAHQARALYLHPPQQVAGPKGYVLVPIEPTEEMIAAAEDIEDLHRRGTPETWGKVYKAMLAAAQGEKP